MNDFDQKKREILDRIDIVDLVSDHTALKQRGRSWVAFCPFHAEKTPSFTVRPEHGTFKCFGCGKGGDVFSFVQFRENVPFIEAMRILADRAGVALDAGSGHDESGVGRADIARANAWAAKFFRAQFLDENLGASVRAYVRSRNISDETAEKFNLGLAAGGISSLASAARRAGIDDSLLLAADLVRTGEQGGTYDTFHDRLMFPIRDATTRVVGFGGRTLVDHRAKYLNTRQTALFDKGRGLYAIDLARDAATERGQAVIVEGYTDCIAAHQAGFPETVATLGTAMTDSQIDLLRRYCDRIILLFDSDSAGEAAAERAIHVALPRCVNVRLARIPEGKDPSDFLSTSGSEAFSDLLKAAVDALEFKWLVTQKRFQADDSGTHRQEAVRDFLRLVAEGVETRAVDAIQRGLLVNQVAHLLRMDRGEVDGLLRRSRPRKPVAAASPRSKASRPSGHGAEQANWSRVLEVLLNEPGLAQTLERVPDFERIASECDRRIAASVLRLSAEGQAPRLAVVLADLVDPQDVARAMDLAQKGEHRGNFEETLRVALDRIEAARRMEEMEVSKQSFVTAPDQEAPSDDMRDKLAKLSQGAHQYRGFSPRRLVRQVDQA